MIRSLALTAVLAALSFGAAAQTTLYYKEGQRVDPQDVRQILEHSASAPIATRSIRLLTDKAKDGGASAETGSAGSGARADGDDLAAPPAAAPASALSLPVQFEFDSARISPAARSQLDALAEGIKMLQPGRAVVIEGHTDARGTDAYNDVLSWRRASAVKIYLVEIHHIDPKRLRAVGVGKHQPIEGLDPVAGENRRVQFRGA